MFIQVIKAKVRDAAAMDALLERWEAEIRPGATGFLGSTSGVTDDGTSIVFARFASRADAEANAARPEQGAWWEEMQACFDGEVTFHDCEEIEEFGQGGSNDAGFVQIMEGRVSDVEKVRALAEQMAPFLAADRPDVIGGLVALHGDGGYTEAVYFTSEAAARAAENVPPSAEAQAIMAEWEPLFSDVTYYDLHTPRLV
jgi:hypothetical protein